MSNSFVDADRSITEHIVIGARLRNGTDFSVRKRLCIVTINSSYMFLIVLSGNDCPKSIEPQALFR